MNVAFGIRIRQLSTSLVEVQLTMFTTSSFERWLATAFATQRYRHNVTVFWFKTRQWQDTWGQCHSHRVRTCRIPDQLVTVLGGLTQEFTTRANRPVTRCHSTTHLISGGQFRARLKPENQSLHAVKPDHARER